MSVELTNAERETCISMNADDRSEWNIFSDDPIMQNRFESIGAKLVKVRGNGKWYTLPANQISLRNPSKPLSDEKRAQLVEQLAKSRRSSVSESAHV